MSFVRYVALGDKCVRVESSTLSGVRAAADRAYIRYRRQPLVDPHDCIRWRTLADKLREAREEVVQ